MEMQFSGSESRRQTQGALARGFTAKSEGSQRPASYRTTARRTHTVSTETRAQSGQQRGSHAAKDKSQRYGSQSMLQPPRRRASSSGGGSLLAAFLALALAARGRLARAAAPIAGLETLGCDQGCARRASLARTCRRRRWTGELSRRASETSLPCCVDMLLLAVDDDTLDWSTLLLRP